MSSTNRTRFDMAADAATAFDRLVEDLTAGLDRQALRFTPGPQGRIEARTGTIARVTVWLPGERLVLTWTPSEPGDVATEVDVRFLSSETGTQVTMDVTNWAEAAGPMGDVSGWFGSQMAAPLIAALTPSRLGDWVTDRVARRPSGRQARATYRDPLYHYPGFRVILDELDLQPDDMLLDVGCGGGAFLKESLKRGCRVAGLDHSREMTGVARELNRAAVAQGRACVVLGRADRLPFRANTFTAASMSGVLGFLPDPVATFSGIRNVLRPGGRFITLGSDARLRGTPAAPEPIASRLRFYDNGQLETMAREAGFDRVVVIQRDLSDYAREVGVPEEHIDLFRGATSFLVASRHRDAPERASPSSP